MSGGADSGKGGFGAGSDSVDPETSDEVTKLSIAEGWSGCKNTVDEGETHTYPDYKELRIYINALGKFTNIPTSNSNSHGFSTDQATADFICRQKGYTNADMASLTTKKWSSCGDNGHARWNPVTEKLEMENGCVDNRKINSLTCVGKLSCIDFYDSGDGPKLDVKSGSTSAE